MECLLIVPIKMGHVAQLMVHGVQGETDTCLQLILLCMHIVQVINIFGKLLGLGFDFTFAMEQEQQASPKFLGWDGTRGLKFGNQT